MMQDDTFYTALHDEILSNNAQITNLRYWSVVLGVAVLGFLNIPEAPKAPTNPVAVAGLLSFVFLMTLLLFRSVYSTGVSSLRVGAYLLTLERKHNQDYGWEHLLQEERRQWKDIKGWALWRQFLDVQVFLQLAYLVVIGYFAVTSGGLYLWGAGVLVFVFFIFTLMVIWGHAEDLQDYQNDAESIDKWMSGEALHYKPRSWYHIIIG